MIIYQVIIIQFLNLLLNLDNIRFVINGKEYDSKIRLNDVTPYDTNNYVFLEVREKIMKAEKIYLDFTIRDKVYTYIIKEG